jgi:cellulose 1,4-beta-cellobiosidase
VRLCPTLCLRFVEALLWELTWLKCPADANWRWLHQTSSTKNCYDGNKWDTSVCTSNAACASNCCLEGADYASTYGVSTSGNSLSLGFVTQGPYSKNVGSRMYLMESDTKYQMFDLLGKEFSKYQPRTFSFVLVGA